MHPLEMSSDLIQTDKNKSLQIEELAGGCA